MMNLIVILAIAFAILFVAAWAISPDLRGWIERPKFRFLADTESYDAGMVRRE